MPAPQTKKDRACDACRRRKAKCNGPSMLNNQCTNCVRTGKPCTYIEVSKPRGPSKAYVTNLEDRLEALEALLRQIRPVVNVSKLLGNPIIRSSWKDENGLSTLSTRPLAQNPSSTSNTLSSPSLIFAPLGGEPATPNFIGLDSPSSTHIKFHPQPHDKGALNAGPLPHHNEHNFSDEDTRSEASSSSETEDTVITSLVGRTKIKLLAVERADSAADYNIRFHGRSDTAGLIEITRQFKHMHVGETMAPIAQDNVSLIGTSSAFTAGIRRPQYWQTPSWELGYEGARIDDPETLHPLIEEFPPLDLANKLIACYFRHSNLILPLLHRPTFNQQWQGQLHRRNIWFACVCMSMFAVASRWWPNENISPRNWNEDADDADWIPAGRRYFNVASGINLPFERRRPKAGLIMFIEIHRVRRSLFHSASLFEVQSLVLMTMYLSGSKAHPAAWVLVSSALRKTQDVGAHRKKVYRIEANVDDELWKRAFWNLVVLDRLGGAVLGRSYGSGDEDFDIDLPLEVDDEYWEAKQGPFTQPVGIPSTATAFNQLIKLTQIMAFALRTLYAVDKSQVCQGLILLDRKDVVNHLSVALDKWKSGMPEHLRWSDDMGVSSFSTQSVNLFTTYHMTQILVYRLLMTSPSALSAPSVLEHAQSGHTSNISSLLDSSMDICSKAATSCARLLNIALLQGITCFYAPIAIHVSYTCAAFLAQIAWQMKLQDEDPLWRGKEDLRSTAAQHVEKRLTDVKVFLRTLEALKDRWDIVDSLLGDINECLSGLKNEILTEAPPALVHVDSPSSETSQTKLHGEVKGSFNLVDYYAPPGFPPDSLTALKHDRSRGTATHHKDHHNMKEASLRSASQESLKGPGLEFSHRTRALSLATKIAHQNDQRLPQSTNLMLNQDSSPDVVLPKIHFNALANPSPALGDEDEVKDDIGPQVVKLPRMPPS